MKRLLRLAARLYPRSWRRRYGNEFDALIDDITPRWTDIGNVVGKALTSRVMSSMLLLPVTCACLAVLGVWAFDAMRPALYGASGVIAIHGVGARDGRWITTVRAALADEQVLPILNRHDVYTSWPWRQSDAMRLKRYRANHGVVLSRTGDLDVWFNDPNPRHAEAVARDLTGLLTRAALPPGQKLVVLRAPEVRGPGKLPMHVFGRYQSNQTIFRFAALSGAIFGLLLSVIRRVTRKTPLPI